MRLLALYLCIIGLTNLVYKLIGPAEYSVQPVDTSITMENVEIQKITESAEEKKLAEVENLNHVEKLGVNDTLSNELAAKMSVTNDQNNQNLAEDKSTHSLEDKINSSTSSSK